MTSVAMSFPRAYRTANDVSGNVLPTCLQDVTWCQWQYSSYAPTGPSNDVRGNVLLTSPRKEAGGF